MVEMLLQQNVLFFLILLFNTQKYTYLFVSFVWSGKNGIVFILFGILPSLRRIQFSAMLCAFMAKQKPWTTMKNKILYPPVAAAEAAAATRASQAY